MKIRRIIAAVLTAAVFILPPVAGVQAEETSITVGLNVGEEPVKSGDTISVRVNFSIFPNITRFGPIEVNYDPSYVSFSGMDKGDSMPSTFSVTNTVSTSVISLAGLDQTVEGQIAANQTAPTADDLGNPLPLPADPSMNSAERVTICVLYFKVLDNVKKGDAIFSLGNLGGFKNSAQAQVEASKGDAVSVPVESVLSSNAALASLMIEDVLFTPEFSAAVFDYETHVSRGQSSVSVIASAADPTSTITVTGADNLLIGTNTVTVKVDAQDGKTALTYTIKVIRDANYVPEGAFITDKSGKEYAFAELPQSVTLPFNFVQETRIVNDKTVPVFASSGVRSLLLYLQDGENVPDFYQYYPETGDIRNFLPVSTLYQPAGLFTLTKVTASIAIPSGFLEKDITINGITTKGYVSEDGTIVVYLTNEAGVSGFYVFDPTDGSLFPFSDKDESATFLIPFVIATGIAVAELAMLAFIIYQIRRRNSPPEEVRHV